MKTRLAQKLAADFWERVGYEESFPRQLERAIMTTTPVFVVKVHRQRLDSSFVQHRLQRRGVFLPMPWGDRRMHGCLVAFKGEAAIFVDGTLSPEEMRVIIAHEFGHYLAEYEWPRLRALRYLGDRIIEVLDGQRPPATSELLGAALADAPIGAYVHYMDRCDRSNVVTLVSEVEEIANIVGAELLAPRGAVLSEMGEDIGNDPPAVRTVLEHRFGLPTDFAAWYAGRIVRHLRKRRSFTDVLGFALRTTPTQL